MDVGPEACHYIQNNGGRNDIHGHARSAPELVGGGGEGILYSNNESWSGSISIFAK